MYVFVCMSVFMRCVCWCVFECVVCPGECDCLLFYVFVCVGVCLCVWLGVFAFGCVCVFVCVCVWLCL